MSSLKPKKSYISRFWNLRFYCGISAISIVTCDNICEFSKNFLSTIVDKRCISCRNLSGSCRKILSLKTREKNDNLAKLFILQNTAEKYPTGSARKWWPCKISNEVCVNYISTDCLFLKLFVLPTLCLIVFVFRPFNFLVLKNGWNRHSLGGISSRWAVLLEQYAILVST